MTRIARWIRNEPVVAITGIVGAAIDAAVSFGVPITQHQKGAVVTFTAALLALAARTQTSPRSGS